MSQSVKLINNAPPTEAQIRALESSCLIYEYNNKIFPEEVVRYITSFMEGGEPWTEEQKPCLAAFGFSRTAGFDLQPAARNGAFVGADLRKTDFLAASKIDSANLNYSDCTDTDFSKTWLIHPSIRGTNIGGASFGGLNFKGDSLQNLRLAFYCAGDLYNPKGLERTQELFLPEKCPMVLEPEVYGDLLRFREAVTGFDQDDVRGKFDAELERLRAICDENLLRR
jgi:hypothetical protein